MMDFAPGVLRSSGVPGLTVSHCASCAFSKVNHPELVTLVAQTSFATCIRGAIRHHSLVGAQRLRRSRCVTISVVLVHEILQASQPPLSTFDSIEPGLLAELFSPDTGEFSRLKACRRLVAALL